VQFCTNLGRRLRPGPPAPLRCGQPGRCYWPIQRPHWLVCSHESACRMHAVVGGGEHGAGGGIGRKRRIGWPSIVSLGPGGFKFIWKPAQPTLPGHNLSTATPRPCYLTVGKRGFRKTGKSKVGGTPGSVWAGSLRAGFCGFGCEVFEQIFHKPPTFGLTARFCAAVCPGKCGVPPARCPPCHTLSQSERCAVSSCTRLCGPRGRPVFRPICGVHAVRCLGCVFSGVFQPNRVRNIENMSLFFGPGLLYTTRGWGLRPGGVLVGSLTCCRSYSCGGGSVSCLVVGRWALLSRVEYLC
jgi:hypothetical protein